jgi:hypothetical protein
MSRPAQSQEVYANVWKMDIVDLVVVAYISLESTISILPPIGPPWVLPKTVFYPPNHFQETLRIINCPFIRKAISILCTILFWGARTYLLRLIIQLHMTWNAYLSMRKSIMERYNKRLETNLNRYLQVSWIFYLPTPKPKIDNHTLKKQLWTYLPEATPNALCEFI